ncbi:MAG: dihydroneopterin aldolase [Bacteroidales bacterium]|jgi:dihydroneopterin aldolase|nr:dihydroneopterin aldolase [Bacteroidales bacterium]
MATIKIEGMHFYAFHGCFEEETTIGTNFLVDLQFDYESQAAEISDNIEYTVNYLSVYQVVKRQMLQSSHLIENVAKRILDAVKTEFNVNNCKVKVSKLNPPLGGKIESVSVEIS